MWGRSVRTCRTPAPVWNTWEDLPCMTPQGARTMSPPYTCRGARAVGPACSVPGCRPRQAHTSLRACLADALVPHAHTKDGQLCAQLPDNLQGDAGLVGRACASPALSAPATSAWVRTAAKSSTPRRAPGPGETRTPAGRSSRICCTLRSSLANTRGSQPRSPRYCGRRTGSQELTAGARTASLQRRPHLAQVVGEAVVVVHHHHGACRGAGSGPS